MKKDLGLIFGLFLVILVLIIFGGGYSSTVFLDQKKEASGQAAPRTSVSIISGNLKIEADIAQTPEAKKKGLGARDSLNLDRGMLFVFDSSAKQAFWMKDMKFAIDIIWIDEKQKIVHVAENVLPEPGKKDSELTRYSPPELSRYVLEINAGLAKLNNLKVGDSVEFSL